LRKGTKTAISTREKDFEKPKEITPNLANAKKNEYIPGERRKASDNEFSDA